MQVAAIHRRSSVDVGYRWDSEKQCPIIPYPFNLKVKAGQKQNLL